MEKIREFQEKTGYRFNSEGLLLKALTHSSYANEHKMKKHSDNERLEFLGDAVLEITVSRFLYDKYPDYPEGELTRLRASIVCEQTLAFCTRELGLGEYLRLGKGEELTGGRKRKSVLSDAFEAVIGAIYLDGGMESAGDFIYRYVLSDIDEKKLFFDSKTILQERVQGSRMGDIEYVVTKESGPAHNRLYEVDVLVGREKKGSGEGTTKKAAQQEAAYQALLNIRGK